MTTRKYGNNTATSLSTRIDSSSRATIAKLNKHPSPIPPSYRLLASVLNGVGRVAPGLCGWLLQKLWFIPFHDKPSERARVFWQSAHRRKQVFSGKQRVDLYFWGEPEAPLLLGVHGWRGSGIQFRHWLEPLTQAGYQICLFDLPAHGQYPARFTHVFEFVDTLLDIQRHVGRPVGVLAHSLGCQTVVQALGQGFQPGYLGFIAPGLNIEAMLDQFCRVLGLSSNVSDSFKTKLAARFVELSRSHVGSEETLFERLSHRFAREHLTLPGVMVADDQDEEIPWNDFAESARYWPQSEKLFTSGLGHYKILKDESVIVGVTRYFERLL